MPIEADEDERHQGLDAISQSPENGDGRRVPLHNWAGPFICVYIKIRNMSRSKFTYPPCFAQGIVEFRNACFDPVNCNCSIMPSRECHKSSAMTSGYTRPNERLCRTAAHLQRPRQSSVTLALRRGRRLNELVPHDTHHSSQHAWHQRSICSRTSSRDSFVRFPMFPTPSQQHRHASLSGKIAATAVPGGACCCVIGRGLLFVYVSWSRSANPDKE